VARCDLLLTGASGFVGRHVIASAVDRGLSVHAPAGDLLVEGAVERAVAEHPPAAVIHLASTRGRAADPWGWLADDLATSGALVTAVARHAPDSPVLAAGSAAQYGMGRQRRLREDDRLDPVSPYGAAKAVLEHALLSDPLRAGVRVIWARAFNHLGPGQGHGAPLPQWAAQVAAAEAAGGGTVRVGRLDVVRDFLDVRDVAEAYLALVRAPAAQGAVNVCSGVGTPMQELLDALLAEAAVPVAVESDPALRRPSDPPAVVGDPGRLHELTGWRPRRALRDSVRAVLAQQRDTTSE
jgi:GDP-4-dehydro-6-deoxy-D-mannose reductase